MTEEDGKQAMQESSTATSGEVMPYFDSGDSLGALQSIVPKVAENLPTGKSTYGFWESISYIDTLVFDAWMAASQVGSVGMCGGLLAVSLGSRLIFVPLQLYQQILGWKMKLLAPDMDIIQANTKRYQ